MGKFLDKIRQVFNIFLIMLLIALASAIAVYLLTTPEQRGTTFWISAGVLVVAMLFETFTFSGIAMRSNNGKDVPTGFTQAIWGGIYFLVVIVLAFVNAKYEFSVVKYSLIHLGVFVVFFVPMILLNMAALRMSGADRREQEEGRINLSSLSNKVSYIIDDLKASGIGREDLTQLTQLSEALKYSDPSPASKKIEAALEDSIKNLEAVSAGKKLDEISRACVLAERALKERNEAVLNSK